AIDSRERTPQSKKRDSSNGGSREQYVRITSSGALPKSFRNPSRRALWSMRMSKARSRAKPWSCTTSMRIRLLGCECSGGEINPCLPARSASKGDVLACAAGWQCFVCLFLATGRSPIATKEDKGTIDHISEEQLP